MIFSLADIDKLISVNIKDIPITNHLGEAKGTAKNLKGVLLKNLIDQAEFNAGNPKLLSEFYFVFHASDGYKVIFSWNEIYNTQTGNNLYIITEKEGKKMKEMDERILVLSSTDLKTGRRYIKGVEKIIVERAD